MKLSLQLVGLATATIPATVVAQILTYDVLDYVDQLIGSANGGENNKLGNEAVTNTI